MNRHLSVDPQRCADALRFLAADAVEQASSGHPGAPLGMAEMAEALWRRTLKHNPANPAWPDRDRFVLSNGHGSMLLYALLHLSGYDLPVDELRRFRQLHSRTPGHPEVDVTPGVETTTGPLGQGLANAVGMALAEKLLADTFNRPGHAIVDHRTYVFVGDGCLMEGISHEVCSLAGRLGLAKLTCLYDDNGISIDGSVEGWFADDTAGRFRAYGWEVIGPIDGHDADAVQAALQQARQETLRPTLIICRTVIGKGAPGLEGSPEVHGAPLGTDELARMRASLGWEAPPFAIPRDVARAWDARGAGAAAERAWRARFDAYRTVWPDLAAQFEQRLRGGLGLRLEECIGRLLSDPGFTAQAQATRKASHSVLSALVPVFPQLFGGSADLSGSNLTQVADSVPLHRSSRGNYLSYGVREFGMAAIMSGMALHGGFIPYGGTFLTFSDYARNAIRMGALMKRQVVHVFTHDSVGLGEDGPTHQPIEQLACLRLIPNNRVWRPCDGVETAIAWQEALRRENGPSCLVLSRQTLPAHARTPAQIKAIGRGGYLLRPARDARVALLATGSEVALACAAAELLAAQGVAASVVSLPCVEQFLAQDEAWRSAVLPPGVPRVSIEAGGTWYWRGLVGVDGIALGIDCYGESGPGKQLMEYFGLTPARVAQAALRAAHACAEPAEDR